MPRASDIKRGAVIEQGGRAWSVRDISRSTPTARGGGTRFKASRHRLSSALLREISEDRR
jgi:elongation factor P